MPMTYYSVLNKSPLAVISLLYPMNGTQIHGHLVKAGIVQILVLGMSTGLGSMYKDLAFLLPSSQRPAPLASIPLSIPGFTNRHRA